MAKGSGGSGRKARGTNSGGGGGGGGSSSGGTRIIRAANATAQITNSGGKFNVVVTTLQGKVTKFSTVSEGKAISRARRLAGG